MEVRVLCLYSGDQTHGSLGPLRIRDTQPLIIILLDIRCLSMKKVAICACA